MMTLIKDNRLKKIYDLVDLRVVADIGTDHGKLVGQLFIDKKIDKAYLTDISAKSLQKAKDLMTELGFDKQSQFAISDGFDSFEPIENCEAVIAGMGGEEIIKILSKLKKQNKITSFVLQPMKNIVNLRQYLVKNGYKIVVDIIVRDGKKYYFVIKAKKGFGFLTKKAKYFGKTNIKTYPKDFLDYLKSEKQLYDQILSQANTLTKDKRAYYKVLCDTLKRGETLC